METRPSKITLTGDLGSGKTLVGTILAEMLRYQFVSTGDFFRKEAQRRNITFAKLHELMIEDSSIDRQIDKKVKTFLCNTDHYVADTRTGPFFEPNAFKVKLEVDEKVGAQRILTDMLTNEKRKVEKVLTLEEVIEQNRLRVASERKRYMDLYDFDHLDLRHYNMKVNTTELLPEEVVNIIFMQFRAWISNPGPYIEKHKVTC